MQAWWQSDSHPERVLCTKQDITASVAWKKCPINSTTWNFAASFWPLSSFQQSKRLRYQRNTCLWNHEVMLLNFTGNHGWVDDWPAMCLCPNACESFQCHRQDPRWCFPPSMHVVCSSLHPSAHPSPPKFSHLPLPLWKTGSRIRTHTSYHNIDSSTLPRILQTLESVWHCDFYTCITLSTETTNLTSYWRSGEFFHPRVVTTFFEYLISGKGEDHSSLPAPQKLKRERSRRFSNLVEQNDAIKLGIKESSILTASSAPWPSMKENNSLQNTHFHQKWNPIQSPPPTVLQRKSLLKTKPLLLLLPQEQLSLFHSHKRFGLWSLPFSFLTAWNTYLSSRVPAHFPVEWVKLRHFQPSGIITINRRIQLPPQPRLLTAGFGACHPDVLISLPLVLAVCSRPHAYKDSTQWTQKHKKNEEQKPRCSSNAHTKYLESWLRSSLSRQETRSSETESCTETRAAVKQAALAFCQDRDRGQRQRRISLSRKLSPKPSRWKRKKKEKAYSFHAWNRKV